MQERQAFPFLAITGISGISVSGNYWHSPLVFPFLAITGISASSISGNYWHFCFCNF